MTFSVLALDSRDGAVGCAAMTGNLAVGAWVLRAAAGVGAVATQGFSVSSLWGDEALARLAAGEAPQAIVDDLVQRDRGSALRQLSVLDASGRGAAWTGSENQDAKGHLVGEGFVLAGNWLANDEVLAGMEQKLHDARSHYANSLARHLLSVLEAGFKAGGDARGALSAALRVVAAGQPPMDLRVDHDAAPLKRLCQLHAMTKSTPYSDWLESLPTLEDPQRS